nr:nucleotide-binding protein [Rhodococcus opacus]
MARFWAGSHGPSRVDTVRVLKSVGLECVGTNRQELVLHALESASDEDAKEALPRLLRLLRGLLSRAQRSTLGREDELVDAVADLIETLKRVDVVLDPSGTLHWSGDTQEGSAATSPLATPAHTISPSSDLRQSQRETPVSQPVTSPARDRRVFLVHGRDHRIKKSMVQLLRTFDLRVIEWEEAASYTGSGSPTTMDIVTAGMEAAGAVVVLFTPDDLGRCRDEFLSDHDPQFERDLTPQPRMNVIFEAGMAMQKDREKVVLVRFGGVREMSDIAGVNYVQIKDTSDSRRDLGRRLRNTGLAVDMENDDWRTAGDFTIPPSAGRGAATPSAGGPTVQPEPPPERDLVGQVKRYVVDGSKSIDLIDLVKNTTKQLRRDINELPIVTSSSGPLEPLEARYRLLYELTEPTLQILHAGVEYDPASGDNRAWPLALQELVDARGRFKKDGNSLIQRMPESAYDKSRHFPALLAFRVIGLSTLCFDSDADLWIKLAENVKWRDTDRGPTAPRLPALRVLDEHEVLDERSVMNFAGMQDVAGLGFALSRYLRKMLRPLFAEACPDDEDWSQLNDQYEYRRGLFYLRHDVEPGPTLAAGERRWGRDVWEPEAIFVEEAQAAGSDWSWWPIIGDKSELADAIALARDRVGRRFLRRL